MELVLQGNGVFRKIDRMDVEFERYGCIAKLGDAFQRIETARQPDFYNVTPECPSV